MFRREGRYGIPAADQIILNRDYILGYSYYFRQAKWVLEIVDPPPEEEVERSENFRPDYRIPSMFRVDKDNYKGSGYHRGHLAASGNHRERQLLDSETFLLSNIAPQTAKLNSEPWRMLEKAVRELSQRKDILETYVVCGPLFYFSEEVKLLKKDHDLPVPHAYFKSVLAENHKGKIGMWSFIMPNEKSIPPSKSLRDFIVPTVKVERLAGICLWNLLHGEAIQEKKKGEKSTWKWPKE